MSTETLFTVLSCVILSDVSANVIKIANTGFLGNVASAPTSRLYRNVPLGVYANNAPYAAFSFQVPTYAIPKNNQILPIKEDSVVLQNPKGFLRDSYGNKYQETSQTIGIKTTIPQQFVQLQSLPAHLSQPLGSSPNIQFKQMTPYFFGQPQYTFSNVQGFAATPYTSSQPLILATSVKKVPPQITQDSQPPEQSTAQQLTSINKDVYVENESTHKPREVATHHELSTAAYNEPKAKQSKQSVKKEKLHKGQSLNKEMSITTYVNGKKTVVNIETKPPLPLLDLSLLKPLTFDNPIVPQVQHFLPRLNEATYQDSSEVIEPKPPKGHPRQDGSRRKHKKPRPHNDDTNKEVLTTPPVKANDTPDESKEFSYEINSPSYKETYSEHKVDYNKATESEPVHINFETQTEPITYTFEKHTEERPIHYTYIHNSKEPTQIKEAHYHSRDENPKHIIYEINSDQETNRNNEERHIPTFTELDETNKEAPNGIKLQKEYSKVYKNVQHDSGNSKIEHVQKPIKILNNSNGDTVRNTEFIYVNNPVKYEEQHIPQKIGEYEKGLTHIAQNPNGHEKYNTKQTLQLPKIHKQYYTLQSSQFPFAPVVHEKSKKFIIKEGLPSEDSNNEKIMAIMLKQQEENEKNFEKAYKNAAYGFPAYNSRSVDVEKDIYDPESYGVSNYHIEFDTEDSPLQKYQAKGDDFPHDTRTNYKDSSEKMKEEYFLDYAVSRPQSLLDRYKMKDDYYKTYTKYKPQRYTGNSDNNRKSAYTVESSFRYLTPKKNQNAKLQDSQHVYEYNYSKEAPREHESAYPTHSHQRHKMKTQFVEPQYQYGFEPISIPRLLDSELAAMASNDDIKSETPAARKKVYKENFYIKKTTTANASR